MKSEEGLLQNLDTRSRRKVVSNTFHEMILRGIWSELKNIQEVKLSQQLERLAFRYMGTIDPSASTTERFYVLGEFRRTFSVLSNPPPPVAGDGSIWHLQSRSGSRVYLNFLGRWRHRFHALRPFCESLAM